MKKFRVLLLTAVLAVAMMASSLSVFATDTDTPTPTAQAGPEVTKIAHAAENVTVNQTFEFKAEQLADNPDGTKPAAMVALQNVSITVSGTADSTMKVTQTGNFDLSGITVPGEYVYKITEVVPSPLPDDWTYNVDGTGAAATGEYYLQVLVDQNGNQSFKMTKDSALSEDAEKVTTMTFENKYAPKTNLKVSKAVTNPEYVKDQKEGYTFTLKLTGSTAAPVPETIQGTKSDGTSVSIANNGTFVLKDGENIVFNNLPAGITFQVIETPPQDVNYNKTDIAGKSYDGEDGKAFTATGLDTGNKILGATAGSNEANYTNEFKKVTVTGVIMNVLPFVMMIAIGGAAAAMYVASRRRKMAR